MHLSLSRSETSRLARVISLLSDRHTDAVTWHGAVTRAFADLLGGCLVDIEVRPTADARFEPATAFTEAGEIGLPQRPWSAGGDGVWCEPPLDEDTEAGASRRFGMTAFLDATAVRLVCRPVDLARRVERRHLRTLEVLLPAFAAVVRDRFERERGRATAEREPGDGSPLAAETRHTLNAVSDGVLCCSRAGQVLWMNASLTRTLEAAPDGEEMLARLIDFARTAPESNALGFDGFVPLQSDARYFRGGMGRFRGRVMRVGASRDTMVVVVRQVHGYTPTSVAAAAERYSLTARELEVLRLLLTGESNERIAASLGISPHTVRHHTERILEKLGVRSRAAIGAALRVD